MTMKILIRSKKFLTIAVILFFFISILHLHYKTKPSDSEQGANSSEPRLAILVPFRDRLDELLSFVPYISRFLNRQNIGPFKIHILNQSDRYRFNRGALANVGYKLV